MARVLIVDDTEIVRRALERAVRRMGHATVSTSSPEEALELACREPPDLALVDYRMPGMTGGELFAAMRAALGERCPRVLFVSATPPEEIAEEVERTARPAGYVRKPFSLEELAHEVAAALGLAPPPPLAPRPAAPV
jgi:two-component system, OmpR family, response regulator